jgi:predicted DNA-binding transcriptional regulator AlpA
MTIGESPKQSTSRREEVFRYIEKAECATVSLPEAARVLGVNCTTAWDLLKRGEFPIRVLILGSRNRVMKMDLARFLAGDEDLSGDSDSKSS